MDTTLAELDGNERWLKGNVSPTPHCGVGWGIMQILSHRSFPKVIVYNTPSSASMPHPRAPKPGPGGGCILQQRFLLESGSSNILYARAALVA